MNPTTLALPPPEPASNPRRPPRAVRTHRSPSAARPPRPPPRPRRRAAHTPTPHSTPHEPTRERRPAPARRARPAARRCSPPRPTPLIHQPMNSSCDEYCVIRERLSTPLGRIVPVGADQLQTDPLAAARRVLGATLTGRGVRALVVEVEAYGGVPDGPWPDPAAHSYRGPTGRNRVMFGPPGRLYTYRSYGIHICANVACGPDGTAAATPLRAGAIVAGIDVARSRRGGHPPPAALADRKS